MERRVRWRRLRGYLCVLAIGGCAGTEDGPGDEKASRAPLGQVAAALTAASDCEDLLGKLQNDAIAKVDLTVEAYKRGFEAYREHGEHSHLDGPNDNSLGGFARAEDDQPAAFEPASSQTAGSPANGDAGGDGDGNSGGRDFEERGKAGPTGFSETNTQVAEVDEADIVKLSDDGQRLYLLHGSQLFTFNAWPASEVSMVGGPLDIEGSPREMFVYDGKAVIFSSVEDYDGDRFPRAASTARRGHDWRPFTKVTVVDVEGDARNVLRELYYEGHYTSSRRHDAVVRIVMQADREYHGLFSPDIEAYDAWGRPYEPEVIDQQLADWRARTVSAIRTTELSDWLPDTYEAVDKQVERLAPKCDRYRIPPEGLAGFGLTRLVGLDLSAPMDTLAGVTVMGQASIVYANRDALVLAQPDYRGRNADLGFVEREQTMLHVFEIDGADNRYQSSGWVDGHPLNQFALDERNGVIRVATTGWQRRNPDAEPFTDRFWDREPVNQVLALRDDGGTLEVTSTTGPIGHENETIHSTRFLGDRAYVVTFERTDPLIVVDVSDPNDFTALGEVEIPGFSTYMHPLDDNHLLTIGESGSWGVQMQIFDVSDDLNPKRTHVHDYGESNSEAQRNHKAFTFYAAQNLLAIPIESYGYDGGRYESGLDVLRVTPEDGFTPLGMADHSAFADVECETWRDGDQVYQECWTSRSANVRRGIFIGDDDDTYVYSIGEAGILVHNLDDFETAMSSVMLPRARHHRHHGDDEWFEGGDGDGDGDGDDFIESEPDPGRDGDREGAAEVDAGVADTAEGSSASHGSDEPDAEDATEVADAGASDSEG